MTNAFSLIVLRIAGFILLGSAIFVLIDDATGGFLLLLGSACLYYSLLFEGDQRHGQEDEQ